ncbi:MAG TPA: hypothetical protein DCZ95_03715 [Verrucomicrobia bacterium]|nr:hypothetical protein [Verrucomicrobiota bacterium]
MLLAIVPAALAAGTVTVTQYQLSADKNQLVIKLACVGDANDGSVPATTINTAAISAGLPKEYQASGFYFYEIWSVAGITAPDAADVNVVDALGSEIYDDGADSLIQATGTTEGTVDKYRGVNSVLTVTVTNQATVSATFDIYIKLVR